MKRALKIGGIILAVLVVVAVAGIGWVAVDAKRDLDLARDTCREEITDKAKYESGVEFIEGTDDESDTTSENGLISYEVTGEVDLINGFGAPVRHTYWCHVGAHNGDVGRPEVTIEQK